MEIIEVLKQQWLKPKDLGKRKYVRYSGTC